jgi:hypothetical protein
MRFYNFITDNMKFTEETIIKYLDGNLPDREIAQFEEAIKTDKALAELYNQHLLIHTSLLANKVSSPPAGFPEKVMQSVSTISFNEVPFFNKTRLIVLSLIIIIVTTTLYYLSTQFYLPLGNAIANEVTLKQFTFNLHPAQQLLSSDILFKLVFYVNGLVCLLLLDRAVLKPYFARRKQRYSM